MELVIFLRQLCRHRIALAAGFLVSVAIAFAMGGSAVSPTAYAGTRVLIDTPDSALLASAPHGLDTLYWRASLLAPLLGTNPERDQIARESHIPVSQFAVIDQELTSPANPASLPLAATLAASGTTDPYLLRVDADNVLPIVNIQASGPDQAGTTRLAAAAAHAVQAGASTKDTSQVQGLNIAQVDPVTSVIIPGGAGHTTMAITAVFLFGLWCAGLGVWARRRDGSGRRRLVHRARSARA
jgi:hypothetical protein